MNIYNVIILDESGSMSSIYRETLTSMNEVLNGIRKDQEEHPEQKNFVTIVTFGVHINMPGATPFVTGTRGSVFRIQAGSRPRSGGQSPQPSRDI